ncbi:MAG: hypothetical protein HY302_00490 [Opitutae bacterium]|nr:hypothetical protein [Opitutae bacterium]
MEKSYGVKLAFRADPNYHACQPQARRRLIENSCPPKASRRRVKVINAMTNEENR